jgi:adenylate cyclase class 2
MKSPIETEIKLPVASAPRGRALLRKAGFEIRTRRVFEQNIGLDDNARSLRARGLLLRVRGAGAVITCTFKGPSLPGRHKRRVEWEFRADSLDSCLAVFAGIGFAESFLYEKYRTEYDRPGEAGHATLDETPIGVFMELEGPAPWIDRTAAELGFQRDAWITSSYAALYFAWCARNNRKPGSMTFVKKRRSSRLLGL